MERLTCEPRAGWRAKVELQGLTWHTPGGVPYWAEGTYYRFDSDAIDLIERVTNELHALSLQAVQHVIDKKRYAELHIPDAAIPLIEASWEKEPPSIYGRFDLAYDGDGPPKLLEYNADTPTALLEAAVIQWDWLKGSFPDADQFNSIHERLIALWKEMRPYLPPAGPKGQIVHFTSMDDREDAMTSAYLADTASQAAYGVRLMAIGDVGWKESIAIWTANASPRSSSCTRGNGSCTSHLVPISLRAAPCSLNRRGRWFSRTRAFSPSSGNSFLIRHGCCRPTSVSLED
ncbi:MAG TPA: glutathionylspermidine synthase family protein [Gemmatimonadaceae bacterium]|nr:glutathionylspermidine synthase family protein [Gemmatimonadaceae bacterium]